jgi:hypothetical protein
MVAWLERLVNWPLRVRLGTKFIACTQDDFEMYLGHREAVSPDSTSQTAK